MKGTLTLSAYFCIMVTPSVDMQVEGGVLDSEAGT